MILRSVVSQLRNDGFAFIRRYCPEENTETAALRLGSIITLPGLDRVQTLRPRRIEEATPNIYSGNFGLGVFPLHTDLAHWWIPPRYLLLRCVLGTSSVSTHILQSSCLIDEFGERSLRSIIVQPRRAISQNRPLLRLLDQREDSEPFLRWDSKFIVPASKASVEVFSAVNSFLECIEPKQILLRCEGDTLIIDNWHVLHGRSAVPENEMSRCIERAYLGVVN